MCGDVACKSGWTCTNPGWENATASKFVCAPVEPPPLWTYYAFFALLGLIVALLVWCVLRCRRNRAFCSRSNEPSGAVSAQAFKVNLPRPLQRNKQVRHDSDDDGTAYRRGGDEETVRRIDNGAEIELS